MPVKWHYHSLSDRHLNGVTETLLAENTRLRTENAALRIAAENFELTRITSAAEAEALANRCLQLAETANALAAKLRASDSRSSASSSVAPTRQSSATVISSKPPAPLTRSPPLVTSEPALPLSKLRSKGVAPLRGSYLVEKWKRREAVNRDKLPSSATWTGVELDRLVSLLSDAYDEHGRPAWHLVATTTHERPGAGALAFSGRPLQLDGLGGLLEDTLL